jgi:hypothetical protein
MILGVSHIVLTSTDLTRDRCTLEQVGWITQFEQRGIPTHPGKQPFMSTTSTEQGLVFMRSQRGTPVELIHYADRLMDASESPLQIVLPKPSQYADLGHLTCPLFFADDAPEPSLITHFVTDLPAALRLWEKGLGFRAAAKQDGPHGSAKLEFRSPVAAWSAVLLLIPRPAPPVPPLLDGPGFRCLSMLSNNLDNDVAALQRLGVLAGTGRMNLEINGNHLSLEMLPFADGLMIELMQVTQQRTVA